LQTPFLAPQWNGNPMTYHAFLTSSIHWNWLQKTSHAPEK
jgi:hypothetical protein